MSLKSRMHVTGTMTRIGAHLVAELLTGSGSPNRRDGVPKSADHLTKEWLTAVLCHDNPVPKSSVFTSNETAPAQQPTER